MYVTDRGSTRRAASRRRRKAIPLDQLRAYASDGPQATTPDRRKDRATIGLGCLIEGGPLDTIADRDSRGMAALRRDMTPERDAWWAGNAASELEAAELAHYICPLARPGAGRSTLGTRHNHLLHAGQSIKKSQPAGDAPKGWARRLWFPLDMANNLRLNRGRRRGDDDGRPSNWRPRQRPRSMISDRRKFRSIRPLGGLHDHCHRASTQELDVGLVGQPADVSPRHGAWDTPVDHDRHRLGPIHAVCPGSRSTWPWRGVGA